MTTPFDELQAYCRPLGPGYWTQTPVLGAALWEDCPPCLEHRGKDVTCHCGCEGTYRPRSRAEAALRLPDAIREDGLGWIVEPGSVIVSYPGAAWGVSYPPGPFVDALASAVLAALKAKEATNDNR